MIRKTVKGILLDEQVHYSLKDICRICESQTEWVIELVEYGVLQPSGKSRHQWQFSGSSLHTAMRARRLQQDLGLNFSGIALVLELLDEVETLRSRLSTLERDHE